MGENTAIQWTHHSWSPWIGCTKVSKGCTHCYADELMTRKPRWANTWGPRGKRERTSDAYWRKPLTWNRKAEAEGVRYRVFPSLCDPFDEHKSIKHEWALDFYELIKGTPNLDWLLLTKRPENVMSIWPYGWHELPNVWIGTSVEDQESADKRIPELLKIPARVRFLSCEPLLGPIDLTQALGGEDGTGWGGYGMRPAIDWIIVGGESGSKARPMDVNWLQGLINQCRSVDVPIFVKQLGSRPMISITETHKEYPRLQHPKGGDTDEWPPRFQIREFPKVQERAHA